MGGWHEIEQRPVGVMGWSAVNRGEREIYGQQLVTGNKWRRNNSTSWERGLHDGEKQRPIVVEGQQARCLDAETLLLLPLHATRPATHDALPPVSPLPEHHRASATVASPDSPLTRSNTATPFATPRRSAPAAPNAKRPDNRAPALAEAAPLQRPCSAREVRPDDRAPAQPTPELRSLPLPTSPHQLPEAPCRPCSAPPFEARDPETTPPLLASAQHSPPPRGCPRRDPTPPGAPARCSPSPYFAESLTDWEDLPPPLKLGLFQVQFTAKDGDHKKELCCIEQAWIACREQKLSLPEDELKGKEKTYYATARYIRQHKIPTEYLPKVPDVTEKPTRQAELNHHKRKIEELEEQAKKDAKEKRQLR
ncbi:coiled-coil domain-containing protein 86-like [Eucalyptus grandis]|uniref:coiled-coil domain-containing protein 86-like n=1 Tax=Eucalyptus grandis TaxID=71139 RepID=UPI00192EAEB7|nr:coiled-coil domain-containing protein 86-like [Eucalyptus grandis]